jgi:hypothetical protein
VSQQKRPARKAREAARKARRQARLAVGPVPPARVIAPAKSRQPKHKKSAFQDDEP